MKAFGNLSPNVLLLQVDKGKKKKSPRASSFPCARFHRTSPEKSRTLSSVAGAAVKIENIAPDVASTPNAASCNSIDECPGKAADGFAPLSSDTEGTRSEVSSASWSTPSGLTIDESPFRLKPEFTAQFKTKQAPFGFNGLGELVYRRTYSRLKPDGSNEQWYETVERVVNGTYSMQKRWVEMQGLGWDKATAQASAEEMYRRMFNFKFCPPGRGLWAMGSSIVEERGLHAALNNCGFVSTEDMRAHPSKPFVFLMDAAMLGVGVGFDTKGAGNVTVIGPNPDLPVETFEIPDSREGWVDSTKVVLDSYLEGLAPVEMDYSLIRPAGTPMKAFGGTAPGPEPLRKLHTEIRRLLDEHRGKPLGITAIVDIMNLIGKCVVSGNVRRTAEIAFGDPSSDEYVDLKNYEKNPHRMEYGWTSNNSVFATLGMDYGAVCERVRLNGEPGFAWLHNMQMYSRMDGNEDLKDVNARGGNPCLEQTLESYELCCLVETFPFNHDSLDDFLVTLKYAFLYAKTVTLGRTHWPDTNRVLLRNRRIGCSMSGIAQFISSRGIEELRRWCVTGYNQVQEYDRQFSEWLTIPRSIKTTSIKPSGTVSLLAGATPGVHFPEARFYIRRMRLPSTSDLLVPLRAAGYPIEPAFGDEKNTAVVSIPVDSGPGIRSVKDVSMWEQLSLAAFMQRHWADNQVSCTVTFDPEQEGPQLKHALDFFQYQLKGVSFLPRVPAGAYKQMPYEAIDEPTYHSMKAAIRDLDFSRLEQSDPGQEKFCDSEGCTLESRPAKATPASPTV